MTIPNIWENKTCSKPPTSKKHHNIWLILRGKIWSNTLHVLPHNVHKYRTVMMDYEHYSLALSDHSFEDGFENDHISKELEQTWRIYPTQGLVVQSWWIINIQCYWYHGSEKIWNETITHEAHLMSLVPDYCIKQVFWNKSSMTHDQSMGLNWAFPCLFSCRLVLRIFATASSN